MIHQQRQFLISAVAQHKLFSNPTLKSQVVVCPRSLLKVTTSMNSASEVDNLHSTSIPILATDLWQHEKISILKSLKLCTKRMEPTQHGSANPSRIHALHQEWHVKWKSILNQIILSAPQSMSRCKVLPPVLQYNVVH